MPPKKGTPEYEAWREKQRLSHIGKSRKGTYEEKYGDEWVRLYVEEGLSTPQIAKKYGVYPSDVHYVLKKRNVRLRSHHENQKKIWSDPQWRDRQVRAIVRGYRFKQTKPEQLMEQLLNELFPGEYVFVGDGRYSIGGKCPDFLNVMGKKKLIEVFGEWHHHDEDPQERIELFRQYGFDCLVIWESELENLNEVAEKLRQFHSKI